jgi:hypothetical protein
MRRRGAISAFVCSAVLAVCGAADAAPCRTSGPYAQWLAEFEREAMAQSISQQTRAVTDWAGAAASPG